MAQQGTIRKYLIEEKNYLDAVIGLPANLFFGTSIPTSILVFKKCREANDNVVFIDASQSFEKGKTKTILPTKTSTKSLKPTAIEKPLINIAI